MRSSQKSEKSDNQKIIDIKTVLKALGSTVRAEILSELATGDKYVLQLVQTLGRTQQDLHRNLNYLEDLGLVTSYNLSYNEYKSPSTKPSRGRRYFRINHSFMLQINIAPAFYFMDFRSLPLDEFQFESFRDNSQIDIKNVEQKTISDLSREIVEVGKKLKKLQDKQHQIFIKQNQLQNQIINQINQYDLNPLEYVVFTKLIGKDKIDTDQLALQLKLHPKTCLNTLESLREKIPFIAKEGTTWSL